MPESELLTAARRALERGRVAEAQGLLVSLVVSEPLNDEAWLMLAGTMADAERKLECLEHARRIDPQNPVTLSAIAAFKTAVKPAAFGGDGRPGKQAGESRAEKAEEAAGASAMGDAGPGANGGGSEAKRRELAGALLEQAADVARRVVLSAEPNGTRRLGLELTQTLEKARGCDAVATRRWTMSAGRGALVKYEKALTTLIANLPGNDPQLGPAREQRARALELFKE